MPIPCQNNAHAYTPAATSRSSIIQSNPTSSSFSHLRSNLDSSNESSSANISQDFAGEVRELVSIALEELILAISPIGSSEVNSDERLPERARKRLKTFCFERSVEIEQRLDPDDSDTVVVDSPTFKAHHLACPFYIRQKERHLSCLTRADIREITDLKRHLWTTHRQPSYCPTCYSTFLMTEDWENHVRLGSCSSSGKPRPEGISALQMQRLARPVDPWVSPEVQWLLIWETVFPGVELPTLPFLIGEVEAAVWTLRDFWSVEGGRIMRSFLAGRRQHDEPNFITLGSSVLNHIIDDLVAVFSHDEDDEQWNRGGLEQTPPPSSFWPW